MVWTVLHPVADDVGLGGDVQEADVRAALAQQVTTADSPRLSLREIQAPIASSQGQRSSSVSGVPLRILATLASGWNASPWANSQPSPVDSPFATVDFPLPETPMTTTTSGSGCPGPASLSTIQ